MKMITGNLLDMFNDNVFDTIIHGCNCQNNMSGGIAYQISEQYPQALIVDQKFTDAHVGEYSVALLYDNKMIINAYTQFLPGPDATRNGIHSVFNRLKKDGILEGRRVGMPLIGCGIGGLEWTQVEGILDKIGLDITVVEFG